MVSYIVFIIIVPCILAFLGVKILKHKAFILIGVELIIFLFLTFIGMIENYPVGDTRRQFISYFGNFKNEFYVNYMPCFFMSIILMYLFKRNLTKR